ncbi:S-adenosyl-L-methionine-dependent methyltransferase [Hyaloscypha hepaticicola]|uniref:S-adenosyl-L-methionine-dependent methyltransferase n=1 Tax=Hyaloscypha hepaticicola TaxID=2082293 RepID=A0A2J6Q8T8_9HELO|nr:S-adenosyl-L-methionine-dependent methyltransferase [Hyaloscypha hepaticicola]
MPNHTSSAERDHNFENIRIATSPEDGDSQVRSDPTDDEDPSILGLAVSLEDGDSQFDSHSASDVSSTFSVPQSIYEFLEENGRTYHKFKAGRYPHPNDEEEMNRLDLQHHLFRLTLKEKLLLCPVDLRTTHRVLDLGTGTGIWPLHFGAQNPQSQVLGIDLSPIQPEWIQPNVQFIVDDIEAIWSYRFKFNLIYGRMLAHSIRDWPRLFQQSFDNLAPGGYVEFVNVSPVLEVQDGSPRKPSALREWSQNIVQCYKELGIDIDSPSSHRHGLKQVGFEDIVEVKESWPLNTWPKERSDKILGAWSRENLLMGLSGSSLALFTRVIHWPKDRIEMLLLEVRNEIKDRGIHASWPIYVVYARKPMR